MKKFISSIYALSFMLVAGATFTACSSDDAEEALPQGKQVYTLTVNASKDADTRALNVDGEDIAATWAVDDVVAVYNGEEKVGELTAQEAGASTTLVGEVSLEAPVTELTLKYNTPNYDNQDGTLEYIAANCDYAEATISGFTFEGSNITSTSAAEFESKQAIVKFNLMDKEDYSDISATKVKVNDITVTPASASNVIYVAVPAVTSVSMEAIVNGDIYEYEKADANLTNGTFNSINVMMTKVAVDLGLPSGTLWATKNIGATSAEEAGLYFAWSSTRGYADASSNTFNTVANSSKYTSAGAQFELRHDAAYVNWGADWHTPNNTEMNELNEYTNKEWIEVNGVSGYKLTSKTNTSKYIFLPVTGYYYNSSTKRDEIYGLYWISQLAQTSPFKKASYMYFHDGTFIVSTQYGKPRECGITIRPVRSAF